MRLDELENAVSGLSDEELSRFCAWFIEFDAEKWNRQLEEDVRAGKLDALADEAIREHGSGRITEL